MAAKQKEEETKSLRDLLETRQTKRVKCMGQYVVINKLTLAECTQIQEEAKQVKDGDEESGIELLRFIVKIGCPDASDFTNEDFDKFPMEDLNELSNQILKHAGMDPNSAQQR